jgi:SAM-dependent methyltransferase
VDAGSQVRILEQFEARHESFDKASRWATHPALLEAFVEAADAGHHQVLEVCCGTGRVGAALAAAGTHVVGADISPHMLSIAAPRLGEAHLADAGDLPFPDESFERIVLRQAWHFLDPTRVSRELWRVAAPGAILVTGQIVPFGPGDSAYQEKMHRLKQPDLLWFPTEESLEGHLASAGWAMTSRREILIEEEMGAWLRWAPETGERAAEVIRLVREAPEAYRRLHRVRDDATGLWDTFRWIILVARKPGDSPRVPPALLALLRCPRCAGGTSLSDRGDRLACEGCGASFPVDAGIPRFRAP